MAQSLEVLQRAAYTPVRQAGAKKRPRMAVKAGAHFQMLMRHLGNCLQVAGRMAAAANPELLQCLHARGAIS